MTELNSGVRKKTGFIGRAITLILVFVVGLVAGMTVGVRNEILNKKGDVNIARVINLYSKTRSPDANFNQYWEVWDKLKTRYVNQPVSDVDLYYGSIQGMVAGLGDPHSVYFPPAKAKEFASDLSGEFEGIGAEIGMKEKELIVVAPLAGSPAEKAGIKAKDWIVSIDKKETFGMSLDDAINKIRGPKGSTVELSVLHENSKEPVNLSIVRDTINVPTVTFEMKEKNIVYLRVSYFNENTADEFDKAVSSIMTKFPKGIILDMRGNPGGFLDRSVSVASEWISSGVIVKEKFVDNEVNDYTAKGKHRLAGQLLAHDIGRARGAEASEHGLDLRRHRRPLGQREFPAEQLEPPPHLLDQG
ncbi:MAG: S41 family peptidase, partial [Patescibacteria group bacterium]